MVPTPMAAVITRDPGQRTVAAHGRRMAALCRGWPFSTGAMPGRLRGDPDTYMKKQAVRLRIRVRALAASGVGLPSPSRRLPPGDLHPCAAEVGHADGPVALGRAHDRVGDRQPETRSRHRLASHGGSGRTRHRADPRGSRAPSLRRGGPLGCPGLRTLTSTWPPSPANLHALSMRTPASRSIRSGLRLHGEGPAAHPLGGQRDPWVAARAPNRCTHASTTSATSSTSTVSSATVWLSARASQSRSSTIRRSRVLSWLTRSSTSWYAAGSRGRSRARSTSASMTEIGVRSSCDASAVNSACRRRTSSDGAEARRPTTVAPANTATARIGAEDELRHEQG